MTAQAVVVGVGMMTAVGLTAAETAASVRAATMRFTETPIRDHRFEPFTLAEVPEDGLPELAEEVEATPGLTSREMRMLRLGTMPLREALAVLQGRAAHPPLVLALPETETTRPIDGKAFLEQLAKQQGGAFDSVRSDASHRGRAGGVTAIGQAVELIERGNARFVLAGGVDSYRDLYVLGAMDMKQRVKSGVHLDGFVPGEGAGFVLLAEREAAAAGGLKPLAGVSRAAAGFETGHLYSPEPYRGEGLALTVTKLAQGGAASAPFEEVYSSMNGESHWAKEWGVADIRNKAALRQGYRMHHPADCYGDTGAASGALMVGLAALGIRDFYRRSPCLVYGSSDYGPRAAVALTAS
jgi:3-oxoacyl-[acyl-carrier-protein] synthase-1